MNNKWMQHLKIASVALALTCGVCAFSVPEIQAATVTGSDSSVSVMVDGHLKQDEMDFSVDKSMRKYLRGQQFNKFEDDNMSVYIYALSFDTKEYETATGKTIAVGIAKAKDDYVDTVLRSFKAEQASTKQSEMTVFKHQMLVDTISFKGDGTNMEMKVFAFQNKDDYWVIIPVYQPNVPASAKEAENFINSIEIY